jgi:PAS domain S-box-containing protein
MKPTIATRVGFPFLVLAVGGVVALIAFTGFFLRTTAHANLSYAAWQQRDTEEELRALAHSVQTGHPQDRARLRAKTEEFGRLLATLERGGPVRDGLISPAPPEILPDILELKRLWTELQPRLLALAAEQAPSGQAPATELLSARFELLSAASNRLVSSLVASRRAQLNRVFFVLAAICGLDLLLYFLGVRHAKRHIVRPIQELERAARRIQAGDFTHRIPEVGRDELASLILAFNQMAADIPLLAQALQGSERTTQALLEALPDVVFRFNKAGIIVDFKASKGFDLFAAPAQLIGKPVQEVLPAAVARGSLACAERAILTGQTQVHEFELLAHDGRRDYEARILASGPEECLAIVRDITERKRSERALRMAESELRRVMDSVSDCIWSAEIDSAGQWIPRYSSPVIERIAKRPLESFGAGRSQWLSLVHPEDRPRVESASKRLLSGHSVREDQEYRILWPDGAVRWVRDSVNISRTEQGRLRLDGVIADITSHRLADEALRQASEALQAVIQASPLAIYALDLDGNVKSWNPAAERIFGWSEQEVLNGRLPFLSEEELRGFYGRLERRKRGDTASALEVCRPRKDGSLIELSIWSAVLRDASGAVSGWMNVAANVTERKFLEEQFRQSQKMEAVGRLAGGVAHDINNLLTVITGYGHMLLEELESKPALRVNVEEILKAVERGSALTNQLLAFSRRQVAQLRLVDLNALVLEMENMLRRVIGEDVELATALSPELGKVKADPSQIQQVIMNLVVNARDAMPSGGKITIETANVVLDEEYARTHPTAVPGSYVMLAVSDTGSGIDAAARRHLFEPFFTTKEPGKGTGLGLSTVYGIVKQSDGEIAVSSTPGQGSTFRIYLPRCEETTQPVPAPAEELGPIRGTETILVVEDEPGVRRLVRENLEAQGYAILDAATPEEGLGVCQEYVGVIHLLLTDVIMPQMSGRELAERVASFRPGVKVLFMSGYTEDEILRDTALGPGLAYLQKPFTPSALARKIREVLEAAPPAPQQAPTRSSI